MSYNLLWIFFLILQSFTASLPISDQYDLGVTDINTETNNSPEMPNYKNSPKPSDEKVISVRITSSVAVGRRRGKLTDSHSSDIVNNLNTSQTLSSSPSVFQSTKIIPRNEEVTLNGTTDVPPNLVGANIEYIKQLNAKKESRDSAQTFHITDKSQNDNFDESLQGESSTKTYEYVDYTQDIALARKVPASADANQFQAQKSIHKYQNPDINPLTEITEKMDMRNMDMLRRIDTFVSKDNNYQTDDSLAESSIKTVEFAKYNEGVGNIPPTATTPPVRSTNDIQSLTNRPLNGRRNLPKLTTVSFNIVHDTPEVKDNEPSHSYISSSQIVPNQKQFYDPPKIYSQPAQIYSEPAKFYSEPSKVYSEPAKIYSEPAKVYSEPAKVYSEPSKFYSEPASLHLNQNLPSSIAPNYSPWQRQPQRLIGSSTINTTPIATVTNTFQRDSTMDHQPEKNYEIDEKISVLTDGRSHGIQQDTSTEKCKQDNCKVGYVVEGRQFKKYRVEERTPDGFIVGEYGVVRNEDGALRGVRYTADGDASPRLIHDALMKFLQLK